MNCTYSVGRWVFTLLISMRYVVFSNLDFYVYRLFRQALSIAFLDANCVRMIRLIQESLFGCASTPTSDQVNNRGTEQYYLLLFLKEYREDFFVFFGRFLFAMGFLLLFRSFSWLKQFQKEEQRI